MPKSNSSSPAQAPIIVWFRQDLRLADHPALVAAVAVGVPVIPVYILDDAGPGDWAMGGASRWWLAGSLAALDEDLQACGSRLLLRRGPAVEVLCRLAAETGAGGIFFTRHYEPHWAAAEAALAAACAAEGRDCRRFAGNLLFEPEAIRNKSGAPFKVFTPFYKTCLAAGGIKPAVSVPASIPAPVAWPDGDRLDDWGLRPSRPDWAGGLRAAWRPGAAAAADRLDRFVAQAMTGYRDDRDRPDLPGTSALSPHLHFGEVSPRQVWHYVQHRAADGASEAGAAAYLRELVWREFSYHLLHHWPTLPETAFNDGFADFPWQPDNAALAAWKRGQTGFPIVDAGMRQLWHTGWMHNRVRMIVASFLTKHLLIPWQDGARWFWDTLVDADLANNSASWQWVAGCGADAAPYFRVFNPVLQGRKFDPDGVYVRRWVPELADVPNRFVHAPWEGDVTPAGYPAPIIDHAAGRQRALDAFAELKRRREAVTA